MKKLISLAAMFVTLTMILSGCYPTGQAPVGDSDIADPDIVVSDTDNSEQSAEPQSSQTMQISDNITLDTNTPENIKDEFPVIKLTLKTWDKEEIERLFLSDKEIVKSDEADEPFHPGQKYLYWETNEEQMICVEPGRFYYEDKAEMGGEFQYGSVYGYSINDCALIDDCYASNEELSAFSSANADERVREMTDKLGLTNLGEPRVISIRADFANEVLSYLKANADKRGEEFKATPWTENEELYILRYPQVFENTELAMFGVTYEHTDADTGYATRDPGVIAVVSKDKILYLSALDVYSEEREIVENIRINCNADKAVDNFKEYLSNLVPLSPTKYYRCQPVYIPYCGTSDNMTVNFKPAWEFAGYMSHEDDDEYTQLENFLYRSQQYEYIWADTGHRYIAATD